MRNLLFAVLSSACLLTMGCAGSTGSPANDEETVGDAEGALTAKHHFTASAVELDWRPGCGVRMPDGSVCYMGLELTFTKQYRDLETTIRTSVDNQHALLTVRLDTWSRNEVHMMIATAPETKELGMPKKLSMSKTYHARVVDSDDNELWSGDISPMPAP